MESKGLEINIKLFKESLTKFKRNQEDSNKKYFFNLIIGFLMLCVSVSLITLHFIIKGIFFLISIFKK